MRLYHFSIIFAMIAISLFILANIKTNNYIAVAKEKEKLDQCFDRSIDDAVRNMVENEGLEDLQVNKQRAVKDFFQSLYASMGVMDNLEKQELMKNYVPVMAITCNDGYYLYYSDEYKGSDNYTLVRKRWSEKHPFSYEDEDFVYEFTLGSSLTIYDKKGLLDNTREERVFVLEYNDLATEEEYEYFRSQRPNSFLLKKDEFYNMRRICMIDNIEKAMSFYCNKYNTIAQQLGITYNFAMPVTDDSDWIRSIDSPALIVLFQGYPYGSGVIDRYNRFVIAGAQINKTEAYYLEQTEWYYLYHKEGCSELQKSSIVFAEEPYYCIMDCVKKGAYACLKCNKTGVYPPNYKPLSNYITNVNKSDK